jgi:hypothetical protein
VLDDKSYPPTVDNGRERCDNDPTLPVDVLNRLIANSWPSLLRGVAAREGRPEDSNAAFCASAQGSYSQVIKALGGFTVHMFEHRAILPLEIPTQLFGLSLPALTRLRIEFGTGTQPAQNFARHVLLTVGLSWSDRSPTVEQHAGENYE